MRQSVANTLQLLKQRPARDEHASLAVTQAVEQRLVAKVRKKRAHDGLCLEGAEESKEHLRHLWEQEKAALLRSYTQAGQNVGKARAFIR